MNPREESGRVTYPKYIKGLVKKIFGESCFGYVVLDVMDQGADGLRVMQLVEDYMSLLGINDDISMMTAETLDIWCKSEAILQLGGVPWKKET